METFKIVPAPIHEHYNEERQRAELCGRVFCPYGYVGIEKLTKTSMETKHCIKCWDNGHDGGYCCIDNCSCHPKTPMPNPKTIEDIMKDFDEKYSFYVDLHYSTVRDFLLLAIETAFKETMVERKVCPIHYEGKEYWAKAECWQCNSALDYNSVLIEIKSNQSKFLGRKV